MLLTTSTRLASRLPSLTRSINRSFSVSSSTQLEKINELTVFGAGLMGAGIAQVAAMNGVKVVMTDVSEGALENGSVYNSQLSI